MRVSSSAKIQPNDHTSISELYSGAPRRSSGALYHSVTTHCVSKGGGLDVYRAMPKSASLMTPRFERRMLEVFRSR